MHHANKTDNGRKGLSACLFALIIGLVLLGGMTGTSYAASIGCGQCHGSAPLSSNPAEQATGHRTGYETTPGYEDQKTPVKEDICGNQGRGLHGVHMNYSSASYGGNGTNTILGVPYIRHGNCNYCHNKHPHENGFIEFSGMSATARQKVTSAGNLSFNGTGMVAGKGIDMDQMDGTGTCTKACHKGTSATNAAIWGNYTSASIKLSCASCHDDSDSATMTLSGAHAAHFDTTVNTGATAMGAAGNAGCVACHADNRNDWVKLANDFGGKAYPHASDGTNVASDNAALIGGISASRGTGATDTCAASCHPRSATLQWGQTMTCNSCHYQEDAPSSANNTGTGALGGSHSAHFDQGAVCSDCHTVPASGDTTHASALPIVAANATITRANMSYNAGGRSCTFTNGAGCHGDGGVTPEWGNPLSIPSCAICHNYPTVASKDWTGDNGHVVRYDAPVVNTHLKASGFDATGATSYATQVGAGGSCNTCHSGGTHRNNAIEVTASGNGFCAPDFTVNVTATRSDVSCSNVKCHSGKTTPNWW